MLKSIRRAVNYMNRGRFISTEYKYISGIPVHTEQNILQWNNEKKSGGNFAFKYLVAMTMGGVAYYLSESDNKQNILADDETSVIPIQMVYQLCIQQIIENCMQLGISLRQRPKIFIEVSHPNIFSISFEINGHKLNHSKIHNRIFTCFNREKHSLKGEIVSNKGEVDKESVAYTMGYRLGGKRNIEISNKGFVYIRGLLGEEEDKLRVSFQREGGLTPLEVTLMADAYAHTIQDSQTKGPGGNEGPGGNNLHKYNRSRKHSTDSSPATQATQKVNTEKYIHRRLPEEYIHREFMSDLPPEIR